MAITNNPVAPRIRKLPGRLWFDRIMAIIATINLLLVIFDLTYIPLRDFWLQGRVQLFIKLGTIEYEFPEPPIKVLPFDLTQWYDLVKGIEPERSTQEYLKTVERLNAAIDEVTFSEFESQKATAEAEIDRILAELRMRSEEIIDTNPFQIANKTGTLERIKNKMRVHIFDDKSGSAKNAFKIFWSRGNLLENSREELNFFATEIQPLLETNYYRPVGENGELVDNFGLIDFPFFILFAIEFVGRTWYISRRYTGVSWFDAMLWRWYDVFLLIPIFRWLRVIPVIIRLNQAKLINLRPVQKQISQGFVANIAEDVTEVVVIQVINQIQNSIKDGEMANFITQYNRREYIDLNNINEITEIVKLIANLIVKEVLPKLEKDIEHLLQYSIEKGLNESPALQNIERLPGAKGIKTNLTQQLSQQLYSSVYGVLEVIIKEDPQFDKLLEKLGNDFVQIMRSQMQAQKSINSLEFLLTAFLEEVKVNYVQRLSEEDVESILEQKRALQSKVQKVSKVDYYS